MYRKYKTNNLNILEIVNTIKMKLFFSFYMQIVFLGGGREGGHHKKSFKCKNEWCQLKNSLKYSI